ncbi:MAG: Rpp14/Pop5 family protein [Candidatus Nanoarchaeia archaeon]|nr:Rpp14/Pop5 family protein [Candidatus Nanoarchaeia archaeon]
MKKLKTLIPSLRERKRYLVFEIHSSEKLNNAKNEILNSIKSFLGSFGLAKAGVQVLETKGNKGIIKVNNKELNNVKTALILTNKINQRDVYVQPIFVTGLLKKARLRLGGN